MDKHQETFKTWNKVYLKYQEKFMDLKIYNKSYDQFFSLLINQRPKILEIGCGPGNISKYLLTKLPEMELLGVDYSPNMIELSKKNNPTLMFEVMDAKKIEQVSGIFDGIIAGFLIPYLSLKELEAFIDNIANKLNDQGILYLSFVEGNYENSSYQVSSSGDRVFFYFYQSDKIIDLLKSKRIEFLDELTVGYGDSGQERQNHKIIIARKEQS
ncbi:class I SAM-dependent methyltransferase [Sphingobacterium endophyticum]|uniref:class I SAM-dependent methyltransferase n=1 Tax=Sphingobacterium endophyticum TaxID=2546448 RepID=UPI0012E150FF|nr:class I SAM-dependent methyltransferase [Sphingobacterium endophyticum]